SIGSRAELPGTIRPASGSTVELAGEPGALSAVEECQAAHAERLCGGDRLSHGPRPRPERDSFTAATVRLGRDARKPFRLGPDGRRQELCCMRSCAEGMP